MTDSVPQRIATLSAQLEGLEAAAGDLPADPRLGASVRRIARSLESGAEAVGLREVAAGAVAIQRAADAHLARSVANFLARIEELRDESTEDVTILIVEDDRTVATTTRAYLEGPGREIVVAESAAAAERVLGARPIHLVLLDLILPDRDGRDVLVGMREDPSTSMIPVIVLSSLSGLAEAECLAVGADEFIRKPAKPKALRASATRHLRSGKIRLDAIRDGLTGLPNRAGINAEYERLRSESAPDGPPLSVAVVALDSLAEVASKMGGDASDRFVLETTAALHESFGAQRPLARWEPAELVAVLPGSSAEEGKQILEGAIRDLIDGDVLADYREAGIEIALSGGVTLVAADQDLHDAISRAERSMYHARAAEGEFVHSDQDPTMEDLARILLVEDDTVTATLVNHRLVREGHEVVEFANGADALSWSEEHDFDLAVLDVKVPGMDGFELLSRLREIPRYAEVPVIMLTGMGSEADVVRGLDLGADDYMLKPFSPTELLARVRRLLHARVSGGAAHDQESGSEPRSPGNSP